MRISMPRGLRPATWVLAVACLMGCPIGVEPAVDASLPDVAIDHAAAPDGARADVLTPSDAVTPPERDGFNPSDAPLPPPPSRDGGTEGGYTPPDGGTLPVPPPGAVACAGVSCAVGQACCYATGACFDPAAPGACATPPRAADPRACASNAQCTASEFCDLGPVDTAQGRCLGVGRCAPRRSSEECGGYGAGVCGCDGRTYRSPCEASQVGVRVAVLSPCGQQVYPPPNFHQFCRDAGDCASIHDARCDTVLGECVPNHPVLACGLDGQCPAGQRCCGFNGVCVDASVPALCQQPPPGSSFPCSTSDDCAVLDQGFSGGRSQWYCGGAGCGPGGGCFQRTYSCSGVLEPVCGCDGTTYTSACWAATDAVRVAHAGACP